MAWTSLAGSHRPETSAEDRKKWHAQSLEARGSCPYDRLKMSASEYFERLTRFCRPLIASWGQIEQQSMDAEARATAREQAKAQLKRAQNVDAYASDLHQLIRHRFSALTPPPGLTLISRFGDGGRFFPFTNQPSFYLYNANAGSAAQSGTTGFYLFLVCESVKEADIVVSEHHALANRTCTIRLCFGGAKLQNQQAIRKAMQALLNDGKGMLRQAGVAVVDRMATGGMTLPESDLGSYSDLARWIDADLNTAANDTTLARITSICQAFASVFGTLWQRRGEEIERLCSLAANSGSPPPPAPEPLSEPSGIVDAPREPNGEPKVIQRTSNLILFGPPGTGKTHATISLAAGLVDGLANECSWSALIQAQQANDSDVRKARRKSFEAALGTRIHFITFHQSYSYEDFIGGLRPLVHKETEGNHQPGGLQFAWQPGIFLKACAAAHWVSQGKTLSSHEEVDVRGFLHHCSQPQRASTETTQNPVVLIIDEINRANMSRVFGELITLLEDDKRLGGKEQLVLSLPNHPDSARFGVPKNLIIIGTMNTADKSLALLDLALRRRFEFLRLDPVTGDSFLELANSDDIRLSPGVAGSVGNFLSKLNAEIAKRKKSNDYGIGHSYGLEVCNESTPTSAIQEMLNRKVFPLLEEYFGSNDHQIHKVLVEAGVTLELDDATGLIKRPVMIK